MLASATMVREAAGPPTGASPSKAVLLLAKILIVEDDQSIRQSVDYSLRRAGYDVRSIDDGGEALDAIRDYRPDLIVLDIMLPHLDGLEIAKSLRETDPETAVIMISALGDTAERIAGLQVGADDYMAKPFPMDELIARVEANLRRVNRDTNQPITEIADLTIDPNRYIVTIGDEKVQLRAKEFALLQALVANGDKISTRDYLAEQVWGYEYLASSRTIDVHIRRLRAAIEDLSSYHLIDTVHGVGYAFRPIKKDEE